MIRPKCEICSTIFSVVELGDRSYCEDCLRRAMGESSREWISAGVPRFEVAPFAIMTADENAQRPVTLDRIRVQLEGAERAILHEVSVGCFRVFPRTTRMGIVVLDGETIRFDPVVALTGSRLFVLLESCSGDPVRMSVAFGAAD